MKVYPVIDRNEPNSVYEAVFSTQVKAEEFIKRNSFILHKEFLMYEVNVDSEEQE